MTAFQKKFCYPERKIPPVSVLWKSRHVWELRSKTTTLFHSLAFCQASQHAFYLTCFLTHLIFTMCISKLQYGHFSSPPPKVFTVTWCQKQPKACIISITCCCSHEDSWALFFPPALAGSPPQSFHSAHTHWQPIHSSSHTAHHRDTDTQRKDGILKRPSFEW